MYRWPLALVVACLAASALQAGARRELSETFEPGEAAEVAIDFRVGELAIEAIDASRVEVELHLRCRSGSERCARRIEEVTIVDERSLGRLAFGFDGISKSSSHQMEIEAVVRLPRWLELSIDMGVGELDISGSEADVYVDMGIGEVRLWLDESKVGSVSLDAGIGESSLYTASEPVEASRAFLIGSELDWNAGGGESSVVVDLGIGEIAVHMD